ncbi:restriction endonuclease subunit S [Mycoplasmopsis anatis]|uniref:restriction endonuclease subunit S n=1 Tax=Mycoplasmopsis anatis TaxID=171279 RepID=UPI001CD88CCB|nr:restriction endonuclease subunit S [Mycoplasmopsis anatis]
MKELKIPNPPIEAQNKIAKILDRFSELTEGTKTPYTKKSNLENNNMNIIEINF